MMVVVVGDHLVKVGVVHPCYDLEVVVVEQFLQVSSMRVVVEHLYAVVLLLMADQVQFLTVEGLELDFLICSAPE